MFLVPTFCPIVKNSPYIFLRWKKNLQFFTSSKLVPAVNFVNRILTWHSVGPLILRLNIFLVLTFCFIFKNTPYYEDEGH
jgi:hypothetical protein